MRELPYYQLKNIQHQFFFNFSSKHNHNFTLTMILEDTKKSQCFVNNSIFKRTRAKQVVETLFLHFSENLYSLFVEDALLISVN